MENPHDLLNEIAEASLESRQSLAHALNPEKLRQWLTSSNWKTRNAAVKIIGELKLTEYTGTLADLLTDRTPAKFLDRLLGGDYYQVGFIRRNAATALGNIAQSDDLIISALCAAIGDPYWEVRSAALKTCRMIFKDEFPDKIIDASQKALKDSKFEVLVEAVNALGKMSGHPGILDYLRKLYDHPNSLVKNAIIKSLRELNNRGIIEQNVMNKEINNIFVPGMYNRNNNIAEQD